VNKYHYGNNKYQKTRSNKANKQNHSTNTRSFSSRANPRSHIQEINLHDHGIHQARTRIKQECRDADKNTTIKFIHGHNNGTIIREFIRNGQLKQSLESSNIVHEIWWDADGVTYFNRA
jgi:hypothetical protein